jgi:hypothetical protein
MEGSAVILIAGLTCYALQRLGCLLMWVKSLTFVLVGAFYFFAVCLLPLLVGTIFREFSELREIPLLFDIAPIVAMASPMTALMLLFNEMGSSFPNTASLTPFYCLHGVIFGVTLLAIRRYGRRLREMYLAGPVREPD